MSNDGPMDKIVVIPLPFTCGQCEAVGVNFSVGLPDPLPEAGVRVQAVVEGRCHACGRNVKYGAVSSMVELP